MSRTRRLLLLLLTLLLLNPLSMMQASAANPEEGTCVHVDVSVTAGGELLTKGPQIANDGGFGHAGTGQTFTFQARTFAPSLSICIIKLTDVRTWQVSLWPCTNYPKPKPARTQSLTWTVTVPLDCEMPSSPGLFSASLTNGKGSAGGYVNIYAGAPGFTLPDKQARALFGPFAMQSDPINSLTGALAAVETDATLPGPGVPLTATRTYNSNDAATGPLGPGWRPSYSDRLALTARSATYLASDGREIGFSRRGGGFVVEPGVARFNLARAGTGYLLTSFDQMRMQFSATGDLMASCSPLSPRARATRSFLHPPIPTVTTPTATSPRTGLRSTSGTPQASRRPPQQATPRRLTFTPATAAVPLRPPAPKPPPTSGTRSLRRSSRPRLARPLSATATAQASLPKALGPRPPNSYPAAQVPSLPPAVDH